MAMQSHAATITQRWRSSCGDEDGLEKAQPQVPGRGSSPPIFSVKRLVLECIVLFMILSWLTTIVLLYMTNEKGCRIFTSATAQARGRFVRILGFNRRNWDVGADGIVILNQRSSVANASFSIEWVDDDWFCLRWLGNLRLIEVADSGDPMAHVVRTGSFGCTKANQQFTFRSNALFNQGAASFLNVRNQVHIRAHGDQHPWVPLKEATGRCKVMVIEMPDTLESPTYEFRMGRLVAALESQESCPRSFVPIQML